MSAGRWVVSVQTGRCGYVTLRLPADAAESAPEAAAIGWREFCNPDGSRRYPLVAGRADGGYTVEGRIVYAYRADER